MILKYKCNNDIAITKIIDATIDHETDCIGFIPANKSFMMKLNGVSSFAFKKIIDDLFETGKADITQLGDVEFFDPNEEIE